jgi:hypothetical protein
MGNLPAGNFIINYPGKAEGRGQRAEGRNKYIR